MLTLKFVFNFSNGEVATILDKTEGAVKSLQHRALVSLQKQVAAFVRRRGSMALEVGIVGLPGLGEDDALQRAHAHGAAAAFGKENVGMAPIADERLAEARRARRRAQGDAGGDPRRRRARHRAGAARQPAAGGRAARRRRRLLGRAPTRRADLETLELELLVADRDHVERRLERVEKQAKSGDAALRKEVEELDGAARAPRRGQARFATTRTSCRPSSSR